MNANEALEKLKSGNANYINDSLNSQRAQSTARASLTGGQSPYAIILSCADSRVAPEQIFDAELGELFVIRVAGNIANTSSIASIEYAVAHLGTELIVVLGHESCGAVGAALKGGDNGYNLNHLVSHVMPAVNALPGASMADVVKKNAELNAGELVSRSSIISNAVKNGSCTIKSGYYSLSTGTVEFI